MKKYHACLILFSLVLLVFPAVWSLAYPPRPFNDHLNFNDVLTVEAFHDGRVFAVRHVNNLVTNQGRNDVRCNIWSGSACPAAFGFIASGTGSGQTAASNALATEVASRCTGTYTTPASFQAQLQCTISYTSSLGITEAGVFNSVTTGAGDMFAYQSFAVINVVNGDSIQFTWTLND